MFPSMTTGFNPGLHNKALEDDEQAVKSATTPPELKAETPTDVQYAQYTDGNNVMVNENVYKYKV